MWTGETNEALSESGPRFRGRGEAMSDGNISRRSPAIKLETMMMQ